LSLSSLFPLFLPTPFSLLFPYTTLFRSVVVSGRDLRSAVENRNSTNPGMWQVNFTLSPEAARRFGPFTEQNKGRSVERLPVKERSEEHTSELQSLRHLVCRLLLEKKKKK